MTKVPDFEAVYRGEPMLPGVDVVFWNLGEPQPEIAGLIEDGQVTSPVLDAGCGIGATTRALARAGYEVLGVDVSPSAIDQARHETTDEGLSAEFEVADLAALDGHDGRFATVIDSAVFHALAVDRRAAYVQALARACRPDAVLHVLVLTADALPAAGYGVNGVTEPELRELVSASFTVEYIEPATIATTLPVELAPSVDRDAAGHAVFPALRLRARRS